MESKSGKKKSSSSSNNNKIHYEAPLGYIIEDVRPNGGIQKFRSAAYSNVCPPFLSPSRFAQHFSKTVRFCLKIESNVFLFQFFAVHEATILINFRGSLIRIFIFFRFFSFDSEKKKKESPQFFLFLILDLKPCPLTFRQLDSRVSRNV